MSFAVGTVEGTARLQLPRRAHRRVRAPGDGAKGVVAIPNWPRDSDSEVRVRPTGERARAHGDARSRRDHSWSTSARGSQACACGECALAARYASPLLRSFVFSQRSIGGTFAFEQSTPVERSSRIPPTAIAGLESPHSARDRAAPATARRRAFAVLVDQNSYPEVYSKEPTGNVADCQRFFWHSEENTEQRLAIVLAEVRHRVPSGRPAVPFRDH